jgi:hypothetical protein
MPHTTLLFLLFCARTAFCRRFERGPSGQGLLFFLVNKISTLLQLQLSALSESVLLVQLFLFVIQLTYFLRYDNYLFISGELILAAIHTIYKK